MPDLQARAVTRLTVRRGTEEEAEKVMEDVFAVCTRMPGFRHAEAVRVQDSSTYYAMSSWDSIEQFEVYRDLPERRAILERLIALLDGKPNIDQGSTIREWTPA